MAATLVVLGLCFKVSIRGDGIGYYAYLPTVVAHRSLNLRPAFDRFLQADVPAYPANLQFRLPNGKTADYKQVGSALMALPFYATAYAILGLTPQVEDPALHGAYQFAFAAASLFYGVLGLLLLFRFVSELWSHWSARLSLAAVLFATPLVVYVLFEPSYSHTFSVAAIIAFSVFLYRTGPRRGSRQWFLLGALGGVMSITHLQEILFLALIPAEAIWLIKRKQWDRAFLGGYALAGAGFALGVLPQVLVNRLIFDQWLPPTAPNITFDFLHPKVLELLFSTHHGWLSWSPLVVLAFAGFPLLIRRLGWFAIALIAIGVGEIYLNAALSDWWGGLGFGSRRLTDQTLLLGLGYAAIFNWLRARVPRLAIGLVSAGIAWTVVLIAQYYYIIRVDVGPSWHDFLLGQVRAIPYVPRLFVQGTVIRDLAEGHLTGSIGTAGGLALVCVAVALLGPRLWTAIGHRGAAGAQLARTGFGSVS